MSELVTGEAVVLGLRAARLPSRALARLLDAIVYMVAYFFFSFAVFFSLSAVEGAAGEAIAVTVMVFFTVMLPVLVETLSQGRSLGKTALGLRVIRTDGGPIRFRHALVRGLVGVIDFGLLGMPAVVVSLFSEQGRRLGDIFAGTLVIRERLPESARNHRAVPPVPPHVMHMLGADLVALDLSGVPDGLWLAIRQLLGRMHELDAPVATGLADRLAADLAGRTGWPVPQGLPSMVYLGAVTMERQRREWERAASQRGVPMYGAPMYGAPVYGAPAPTYMPVPAQAGPAPAAPQQPNGKPVRVLGAPQEAQPAQAAQAPQPQTQTAPAPPTAPPAPVVQPAPVTQPDPVAQPVPLAKPVVPPQPSAGGGFAVPE
ncbi:RDD family protein [Kitasatospora sp. NPDC092948]|uniref:RDD family protein n=1 Tax=Kitasatospora sp. NPDC092948 TaxID=3364088 RepID=UPI0037FE40A6